MESKFKLHLCANYVNDDLKSAINSCILCDYVIEELRLVIKRMGKYDLDLFYIHEAFKEVIEKSKDVTFATIAEWEENKSNATMQCVGIIARLDEMASEVGKITAGELIEEFRLKTQEYYISLLGTDIDINHVDLSSMQVKEEFIDNMVHELTLVDEGQFLSDLGTMQVSMVPLDVNKYRNKFVEQKLRRLQTISASVSKSLESEFDSLLRDIENSHTKLYKIAYKALNDGERSDEAREVCKVFPPHRRILDRLEDRLTEANEIKRQLTIRAKRLREEMDTKLADFANMLENSPHDAESINRDADGYKFVTEEYLTKIDVSVAFVNELEQKITERYKMVDNAEIALKGAMPSESELKRYSNLAFKFEDLYVRLELARSQIDKKDTDFRVAIKTAILGLGVLVNQALIGKDVFMRNSLLSAVFNSATAIYDLVEDKNKSAELTKIDFVTVRLEKYSRLNQGFLKDLQTFRRVCNNIIRDVAIMISKPFSLKTMLEVIDSINLSIEQIDQMIATLKNNHEEQSRMVSDILNVK